MLKGLSFFLTFACNFAYKCAEDNCFAWRNKGSCDSLESCSTQMCNFDSSADFTLGSVIDNFKSSDCFSACLKSCPIDLLSNDICDAECNLVECGYDIGNCGFCGKECEE